MSGKSPHSGSLYQFITEIAAAFLQGLRAHASLQTSHTMLSTVDELKGTGSEMLSGALRKASLQPDYTLNKALEFI